jgi:hypothetical protein
LIPAEPVFVHLALVGSMIVYCLSEPLRQRFAEAARTIGLRVDMPIMEMAEFLARVMGRGLSPAGGPQVLPGGGV